MIRNVTDIKIERNFTVNGTRRKRRISNSTSRKVNDLQITRINPIVLEAAHKAIRSGERIVFLDESTVILTHK